MRQNHQKKLFLRLLLSVFFCGFLWGQRDIKSETTNILERYQDYFKNDRKSIHLHLNKTTFASGEHIWFSTYVFNKRTNRIDEEDTYVYVDLLDKQGTIIASRTVAYSDTSGTGEFDLDAQMTTGDYFLQAYTMEMNHYAEDDSSVYPIRIINFESNTALETSNATEIADLRVSIQAESGQLLEDVFGTCGIQITDINGKPVLPDSVILSSKTSRKSISVPISTMGIGKFSIIPKRGIQHLVKTYYNNKVLTTLVPLSKKIGFSIATDHNYAKNQLLVSVQTNKATQDKSDDSLTLVIHKDGNVFTLPISMDKGEQYKNVIIPYSSLFPGVNTLSLFKNNRDVVAERMVFNQPENRKLKPSILKANRSNDTITLYIKNYSPKEKTSLNKASISVLPAENRAMNTQKSIASVFFLDDYVPPEFIKRIQKTSYLEKNIAKYDLDAFLLAQGSVKYQWRNILKTPKNQLQNAPKTATISGYVNLFDTPNDSMKVMLYSATNGIFETTELDEEKKFQFETIAAAKKSKISMTLIDKKGQPVYANFFFTLQPTKKAYRFPYQPKNSKYSKTTYTDVTSVPSLFKKVEQLDEVVVAENKLKYERFFGKFNGRKIDSTTIGYITLESFIRSYGFMMKFIDPRHPDIRRAASRQLFRSGTGTYGKKFDIFPAINFNGHFSIYMMDFAQTRMEYIDEVYYLRGRTADYFVVFTNDKYENHPLAEQDKKTKEFMVENGHDLPKEFVRPAYYAFDNDNYKHYGVVSWIPDIVSNEQGVISFKIPDDGQSKLKVHLEGFGEHGEYLSDVLTINLDKELK